MENRGDLLTIKDVWVLYEFSTGSFTVIRKKLDVYKFLDCYRNTFDYRWRNSDGMLLWENKYIIKRAKFF